MLQAYRGALRLAPDLALPARELALLLRRHGARPPPPRPPRPARELEGVHAEADAEADAERAAQDASYAVAAARADEDADEARRMLERALELRPADTGALCGLAQMLQVHAARHRAALRARGCALRAREPLRGASSFVTSLFVTSLCAGTASAGGGEPGTRGGPLHRGAGARPARPRHPPRVPPRPAPPARRGGARA